MTGRTLVLLRHGRTAWNHEGRIQGQQDVGLDEVGHAEAHRVASAMIALSPSLLWASDLARARDTAAYVARAGGMPVSCDARLREFSFGAHECRSHAELAEIDSPSHAALRRGDYEHVTGAEPVHEVVDRMTGALHDLLAALGPGCTGVAVSHGAAIRVATAALLRWPGEQFRTLRGLDNCGWVALAERPGDDELQLSAYNRTS